MDSSIICKSTSSQPINFENFLVHIALLPVDVKGVYFYKMKTRYIVLNSSLTNELIKDVLSEIKHVLDSKADKKGTIIV